MRHPIDGTSRFTTRIKVQLAVFIGVVVISGVATSADDRSKKRDGPRYAIPASLNSLPAQNTDDAVAEPPYPAFSVNSHAAGDELVLQREIVKVLCERAESYPGREEHFGWLANDELYQKTVQQVYGLKGYILEAKNLPGGGWLAKVSVRPSVEAVGLVHIKDFILEEYRYQGGVLTLIQTDADVPKPDRHVFILH